MESAKSEVQTVVYFLHTFSTSGSHQQNKDINFKLKINQNHTLKATHRRNIKIH